MTVKSLSMKKYPNRLFTNIFFALAKVFWLGSLVSFLNCRGVSPKATELCPKPLLAVIEQPGAHPEKNKSSTLSKATGGQVVIRNATIWTASGPILKQTDLLLDGAKIAQIGKNLAAPAGAMVIDATGKHLTP